jgi:hypothetical protein
MKSAVGGHLKYTGASNLNWASWRDFYRYRRFESDLQQMGIEYDILWCCVVPVEVGDGF